MNDLEYESDKREALDAILHRTDGPVTPFVALSRALDLAAEGKLDRYAIANALDGVLDDFSRACDVERGVPACFDVMSPGESCGVCGRTKKGGE